MLRHWVHAFLKFSFPEKRSRFPIFLSPLFSTPYDFSWLAIVYSINESDEGDDIQFYKLNAIYMY